MSIYLRKSINVGPFRFNLSKSGVGLSVGVKGLRLGAGPRGNYVHMGRNGIYYKATLPPKKHTQQLNQINNRNDKTPVLPNINTATNTHESFIEIDSIQANKIVDSSSKELLSELNSKMSFYGLFIPLLVLFALVLGWLLFLGDKFTQFFIVLGLSVPALWAARVYDESNKYVVLFYELDEAMAERYNNLLSGIRKLSFCSSAWHVESSAKVIDSRYHAGAGSLIQRKRTSIGQTEVPRIKTNVKVFSIGVGSQTLYFFPDRVFIFDKNGAGTVSYQDLEVDAQSRQFIEDEAVPRDAKIVGSTWRYTNKSGSPDRRFKDNRQIPVCLYENIKFLSRSGLCEMIQCSQPGVADELVQALRDLSKNIPIEKAITVK